MSFQVRSAKRRWLSSLGLGLALVALHATTIIAARPSVETASFHADFPFLDCPDFTAWGGWDIDRRITTYFGSDGLAVRDTWHVEFNGRIYNPATGVSVADRGVRDFLDELLADGSFGSTIFTYQRTNPYVHEAGLQVLGPSDANGDQPLLRQVGREGFTDANVAGICAALSST